jgi:hypothetical protein
MGTLTIPTVPFTLQTTNQLPPYAIGTTLSAASYTFGPADAQVIIPFNSGSGQVATIPADTFQVGTQLTGVQMGAGALTFASGNGVTLLPAGILVTAGRYGMVSVLQMSTNVWIALGAFLFTP